MKPKRILVIGSSNTDMTVKAHKLPSPGETVLGGSFSMGYGGKGANQAIAAKRLGGDVSFVCKVGRDSFGEMSLAKYRSEGLDISGILYSGRPSGVALITVDASAENSIVVASGANADVTVQDMRDLAPVIAASSILLLQLEIPLDAVVEAAGGDDTFEMAWRIARPNAVVVISAMYERDQALPLPSMYGKNLTFKTGGVDANGLDEVMALIAAGKLDTSLLISHRYPLNDILDAYRAFETREDGCLKVVITPWEPRG